MDEKIWISPKLNPLLDEAETPLWFWNAPLEEEELVRQLKLQTEIGVKATNPHARTEGGHGYQGGYLDKEWFDVMKIVLDYKKKNREKMWLYDEIDWPAGTCNKTITQNENYREKYITIEKIPIPADTPFRAQLHTFEGAGLFGMGEDTDYSKVALNIHIIDDETGEEYYIPDYFDYQMFGPELEFISNKDCTAYITNVRADSYEHGGDESVNYLDKNATRAFLSSTYDKYLGEMGEEFGKTITTVFNDETRMCHAIPWSNEFPAVFLERHGYDIRNEIYRIILQGTDNGRVRVDYYDTVAYLYQTRYFREIYDWCEKHNLKLFAHLLGEETLFGHVRYSGDYMRQTRFQHVVGADYLGKGIGSLNLKFTSAAAHSYGKEMTAVEIFAGCGWDLTFDEYTRMITFAFQQGIQMIINHGFFYSAEGERANDWPPSEFFQWKYWYRQSDGNDMIRRLHYALTGGIYEADVLVYLPTESLQLHYLPDTNFTHAFFKGAFLKDDKAVRIDRNIQLLLNGLLSENIDFDILHRDAVENFTVKSGKIVNTKSGQIFSTLILPMCEVLPLSAAKLAEEFVKEGGKIIFADEVPSLGISRSEDAMVEEIMDRMCKDDKCTIISSDDVSDICGEVKKYIPHPVEIVSGTRGLTNEHPAYPPYLIDPYLHTGENMTGVGFTRYIKDGERRILVMNYGNAPDEIELYVEGGSLPMIWDTLSGEIIEAEVVQKKQNGAIISLTLPCNHGLIITSTLM